MSLLCFSWTGSVYALSFNGSFNGDGANLNLESNSIIQAILSNISALSKLCSSTPASLAPTTAAPTAAPTSISPSYTYPVGI